MEVVSALMDRANRSLKTADHLTYVTYPLLKDTKLVIAILENINNALILSVEAMVEYDRMFKRITAIPQDFRSRFELFKKSCAPRYNIDREHIAMISDIDMIMENRKRSPMEFVKRDKLVVLGNDFRTKTVDYEKMKVYVNKAKAYMLKINRVLTQNARRF